MLGVLFRLIPYLYSFVKEMNRKDMETGTTRKQRAKLRTMIAILVSILVVYIFGSGYYMYRAHGEVKTLTATLTLEKERGYTDMTKFVPRKEHEKVVNTLTHKIGRAEFVTQIALDEIESVCRTAPKSCTRATQRTKILLEDLLTKLQASPLDTQLPEPPATQGSKSTEVAKGESSKK